MTLNEKICKKKYIGKIGNKKDNDVAADVAQLGYSNNKYYILASIYIYIDIDID